MTLAAILEQSGIVPVVPARSRCTGTQESKAQSHVPVVPVVPAQKGEGKAEIDRLRNRLLRIADADRIDSAIIRALPEADVADCAGLDDATLCAYIRMLRDSAMRERGKRPDDETVPAVCRHCGPVWIAPEGAACAPVVDRWPRVLGCPWCHVTARDAIPRPFGVSGMAESCNEAP